MIAEAAIGGMFLAPIVIYGVAAGLIFAACRFMLA